MTESVQVTNEDVKTSTSKPNPKALKSSNDNAEHGKTSEKAERPLTKVVVRHLPPTKTLESFLEQVSPLPPVDYMYFVKADSSLGVMSCSRAYLNFVNIQDLIIFTEKFDNYVFVDAKGNEYPAIVEFAPFQRIPKQRTNRKKDPRLGTIENDPYYIDFLEALKAEEAQRKSVSKSNKQHFFETTGTSPNAQKVTSTPLLEYLKARKQDKIRVKEDKINEKKKRELERKKAREERGASRQGEGDTHPVKVVTPPHGRNDRNDTAATHSPSPRHSEDKRSVRDVKRREDDKGRTRDRDRDADVRLKDSKRPGKSYQEERQRLNERRQAAKVVGSTRTDGDADEGAAEAKGVSSNAAHENEPKEFVRRSDKVIRPSAKALESKRTPERPRRPERKAIPNAREAHKEEPRKKSYAQEREQRRNTVKKDAPTTCTAASEETRIDPQPPSSEKGTSGKPEKDKTDQVISSNKGKDPRAERRIRNKDRPSIEIYRPGMGRFSRQRLEREKGSIVGSSTERDSASPSPSPSPSVSRAASVTAKPSAHTAQSKGFEEPAGQPEEPSNPVAATAQTSEKTVTPTEPTSVGHSAGNTGDTTMIGDTSKAEDTASKTEDSPSKTENSDSKIEGTASKTENSAFKTEDSASKTEDSASKTEDAVSESEDTAPKTERTAPKAEGTASKTEDAASKTEDTASKTEDTASKTEDVAFTTEDTASITERTVPKTEGTVSKTEDAASKTEDTASKTEHTAPKMEDTASKTEDSASKTEDTASKTEHTAPKMEDTASKTEDSASKTEDTASKTEDTASEPEDSPSNTEYFSSKSVGFALKTEDSDKTEDLGSKPKDLPAKVDLVETTEDQPVKDSIRQEVLATKSDDPPQLNSS